jgi:hypothetical protein
MSTAHGRLQTFKMDVLGGKSCVRVCASVYLLYVVVTVYNVWVWVRREWSRRKYCREGRRRTHLAVDVHHVQFQVRDVPLPQFNRMSPAIRHRAPNPDLEHLERA